MEGISDVTQLKNNKLSVQGDGKSSSIPVKTAPMPYDSVELSNKKNKKSTGFGNVVALLAGLSLLVAGGTFGGVKLYDRYFHKLACGIKKGEIDDALYNFIKKNDPKGKLFSNKNEIHTINEKLTDDNFLILKQLVKMKNERSWSINSNNHRFNLSEITDLLTSTNEFNLKYLEQLAKKSEKKYGVVETVSTSDMLQILKTINPDNDKVAAQLIDIAKIDGTNELVNCLKHINKDNVDIYQMLLSTRIKNGKTELGINDIKLIEAQLEKTKNPNCAELFLNLEKSDGTGQFRYKTEDIVSFLNSAKEDNYQTYKKLFALKSTKDIDENILSLIKSTNKDNIDLIDTLLTTKKCKSYSDLKITDYVVFDDWKKIENILNSVNSKNKDVAKKIFDIVDDNYFIEKDKYSCTKIDKYLSGFLKDLADNPEDLKRVEDILDKGVVGGKQTLNFQKFYNIYSKTRV